MERVCARVSVFTLHQHLESESEFYTVYLLSFIPFHPLGPFKPSQVILDPFCIESVSSNVRQPCQT